MSAAAVAMDPHAATYEESLAERLSGGSLAPDEVLRYAIAIATGLRDLHRQGLVYGAVSSHLILLGPSGAFLRSSGGLAQLGDSREDVKAFGALLGELLRGVEAAEEFRAEIDRLALSCREEIPEMRHVLIVLRLLRLRQTGPARRRPVVVRQPAAPAQKQKIRLRIHMALHWKPLVNLVAAALTGK